MVWVRNVLKCKCLEITGIAIKIPFYLLHLTLRQENISLCWGPVAGRFAFNGKLLLPRLSVGSLAGAPQPRPLASSIIVPGGGDEDHVPMYFWDTRRGLTQHLFYFCSVLPVLVILSPPLEVSPGQQPVSSNVPFLSKMKTSATKAFQINANELSSSYSKMYDKRFNYVGQVNLVLKWQGNKEFRSTVYFTAT